MNFIKFVVTFVLIVACVSRGDGKRRQKRTLGTLLQFFGYRLVPLNEQPSMQSDKLRSPSMAQNQRMPKRNRIQTVMPYIEMIEMTTQVSETMISPSVVPSAMTEMPSTGDAAEATTVNVSSQPLRIILEDTTHQPLRTIFEDESSDPTESTIAMSTTETTLKEKNLRKDSPSSVMSARLEEEATPLPDIASLPLGTSNQQSLEPQPPYSDSKYIKSFVKIDANANQDNSVVSDTETNQDNIDSVVVHPNSGQYDNYVEILRSDDVSSAYFDQQSFPVYGNFPSWSNPPQQFSYTHEPSYEPQQEWIPQEPYEQNDYSTSNNPGDFLDVRSYYE